MAESARQREIEHAGVYYEPNCAGHNEQLQLAPHSYSSFVG